MSEIQNKEEEDEEGEEEEEEEEKKEDQTPKSSSPREKKTNTISSVINTDEETKGVISDIKSSTTKKYRYEELDPIHRSIFPLKSNSAKTDERFKMSAQEYLETYKVSTILQDAFRMVLDRRSDNARALFIQYLEATLKGEHILLRDHAFLNATPLNRK